VEYFFENIGNIEKDESDAVAVAFAAFIINLDSIVFKLICFIRLVA